MRKAAKLAPAKKNGKEKHTLYRSLENDDEDEDFKSIHKRESALDYYDDENDTEDEWEDEGPDGDWDDDEEENEWNDE